MTPEQDLDYLAGVPSQQLATRVSLSGAVVRRYQDRLILSLPLQAPPLAARCRGAPLMAVVPRLLRRLALAAALGLAGVAALQPARAAELVTVSGEGRGDMARIVFEWPKLVDYRTRIINNRLVVSFSEPALFDLAQTTASWPDYLGRPVKSAEGRIIIFPLHAPVSVTEARDGMRVVIELQRTGGDPNSSSLLPAAGPLITEAGTPEAGVTEAGVTEAGVTEAGVTEAGVTEVAPAVQPKTVAAPDPSTQGPLLGLRVGEHPGFSRLVFDWTRPVDYDVVEAPGRVTVSFDAAVELNLENYRAHQLRNVAELTARVDGGRLVVSLVTAQPVAVRHFLIGSKVVIDLQPATATDPQADPQADPPAESQADPQAESQMAPNESDAAAEEAARQAGVELETAGGPTATAPDFESELPGEAEGRIMTAMVAPRARAPDIPLTGLRAADEGGLLAAPGGRVSAKRRLVLRFPWAGEGGRVAAFRRGRHLWLVFDRRAPEGIAERIAAAAPDLAPVERLAVEGGPPATVLRTALPAALVPALRREGGGWIVDLQARPDEPRRDLPFEVLSERDAGRVLLRATGGGPIITVTDPTLGDLLHIVPLAAPGLGVKRSRNFPQFRTLASHQGIVIVPLSDGLRLESADIGLMISDEDGLLVSSKNDRQAAAPEEAARDPGLRLLQLADWRRVGPEGFEPSKQALLAAILAAPPAQVDIARLGLARFFFAHGRDSEALSALRLISRENQRLAIDPQVVLLRAASLFLTNEFEGAGELLDDPVLDGEWEATLWQAALAAVSRDWAQAVKRFTVAEPLIAAYPHEVRSRLRLLAAEAHLGLGDSGGAGPYLEQLREDDPTSSDMAQLDYLEGRRLALDGQPAAARRLWEAVAEGRHRPMRARARLALVDLDLAQGNLGQDEAIEILQRLQYAWRGDAFEFVILERLAGLYSEVGQYREALLALRQAATHLSDSPRGAVATQRIGELFTAIFLGEPASQVPPITALTLYEEFKELTPVGHEGDLLIARLAERLVEADLLERAAGLLEQQVTDRLYGEDKVRVGARLALIRLLDDKPAEALSALQMSAPDSAAGELPAALLRDRRYLKARALSELGDSREASGLLQGDDTVDALRLRAAFLWAEQDWAGAAAVRQQLIPPAPEAGEGLDEASAEDVLNLAVAYSLADERQALAALGRDYRQAMAATRWADDFTLLASELETGEAITIADELASMARIKAFMSSYKERLQQADFNSKN